MFDKRRNKQVIALVLKVLLSDLHLSAREDQYLKQITNQLGENFETIENVKANLHKYKLEPPRSERDRMLILYYLLFAISSDYKVTTEEEKFMKKATLALGFREEMCNNMMSVIKKHLGIPLPPNALMKEIKAFLN